MPGFFTHIFFSERLVEKLPIGSKSVIQLYPDAYRLGSLGADILDPIGRTHAEMDVSVGYKLFENTANYIFSSGSKCQLSYMLGMTTHYLLDSRINPYIYFIAENGAPHYFGAEKTILSTTQLSDGIDHYIACAHLEETKADILAFSSRKAVNEDIADLYDHSICDTIGHRIDSEKICKCFSGLKLIPPVPYDMLHIDYMNTRNNSWDTVRNGNWSTNMSIEELLEKVEPIAIKMINDYMARARSGVELNRKAFRINACGVLAEE